MNSEKVKLNITRFFSDYFQNFGKLILSNLILAIPILLFGTVFYLINFLTGLNLWAIALLPIVFVFPFLPGIFLTTRNIVRGDRDNPVFKNFTQSLKDNYKQFLIHGIVFYCAIFFCFSSITLYWELGKTNGVFYLALGIVVFITLILLFMFYNIPTMTVTFDLSVKDIYKNCFLMSFGEIKNNFFVTLGLFLLFIFCASVFFAAPNVTALVIIMISLSILLVPSTAAYIMNFYVYKDMENVLVNSSEVSKELQKKIDDKKRGKTEQSYEPLDFSSLDLDPKKDMEEYLYFNGKMIKRRVLIEMRDKQGVKK